MYYADINECENDDLNNCHENAQCINMEGSFTCSCSTGYTGDGINCTSKLIMYTKISYMHFIPIILHSADINECELEIDLCSPNANCTDTDGSFNCTCREGFEGDGFNCTGIK